MINKQIQKRQIFLLDYSKIADIHADRLNTAIVKTHQLFPIAATTLHTLNPENLAFLDMITNRFGKLQDIIGAKILPLILELLGETDPTSFIDKLNRLEKLNIINSASWWMELREIRNQITHDYPNNYEQLASDFNKLILFAHELLKVWANLKKYISNLIN